VAAELSELLADEIFEPAPDSARRMAAELCRRHGAAVVAVVFYGSCLRRRSEEGVLDFYLIVDDYRRAYDSRWLARVNAWFPPNVFYVELGSGVDALRAKYAVLSARDLERAAGVGSLRSSVWARFCQPLLAIYARDDAARALLVRVTARSVETALTRLLPALGGAEPISPRRFWQHAFGQTYAAEMRPEQDESVRALYLSAPERFDRVALAGVAALAKRGAIDGHLDGDAIQLTGPEGRRRRAARAWRWRRPLAKAVYLAQLVKSAFTFGDWLPYALWKLERHTGTRLEPTERQRRHPFLWAWPLFVRVWLRRDVR
jgi:hypothetical protein